jgi:hypothetical protein
VRVECIGRDGSSLKYSTGSRSKPDEMREHSLTLGPRPLSPHLLSRLVRSEPDIDCLPQEPIPGPRQIGDLGDQLRLNQCTRERTSGDPKRVCRGGGALSCELARARGSRRLRKSASTLSGIPVPTRPA